MDVFFLLLRLLHVLLGVFWAGTIFFFAFFFMPSLADLGPDAGKMMGALQKRNYPNIMAIAATITIISGLLLYYRMSGGFDSAFMRSHHVMGYGVGGAAAIIAMAFGMAVLRPAAVKLGQIMQSLAAMPAGPEREAKMAEVQKLRQQAATGSKLVTALLLVTVTLMALSRYL